VGELGVSSDEDPSPEPSWNGDVASAVVDWSNMLGSSLSSPPRGTKVSSSRRPQAAGCDKTVGSSSRQAAPPLEWISGRSTLVLHSAGGRFRAAEARAPFSRSFEKVEGEVSVCTPAL
jgi:hypothetical protein